MCLVWQAIKLVTPQLPHIQEFIQYLKDTHLMEKFPIAAVECIPERLVEHYGSKLPTTSYQHVFCYHPVVHVTILHQLHPPSQVTFDEAVYVPVTYHNEYFPQCSWKLYTTQTFNNESSIPERMSREFCHNSRIHLKNWISFCLWGVIVVRWAVIIIVSQMNKLAVKRVGVLDQTMAYWLFKTTMGSMLLAGSHL